MTFAAEKLLAGRQPLTVVELDLDTCSLDYGVAPCTATGAAGEECWNTRHTCQDVENFTITTTTYRFSEPSSNLPAGITMFPCLKGVDLAPAKITPGEGLGYRAAVTVTLQDFSHHDRGIDPYVSTRTYDPSAQGTFFGKLFARNPFWQLREMRIRTGYLTDPFDWANFRSRVYVIDSISGPDSNGRVRIIGKDLLKLADDDKAQCPVASEGSLSADITAVATSLTLIPAGVGADYGTSGRIRIGSELIDFGGRTSDTLTSLTRAVGGTDADTHDEDDSVQLCYDINDENVVDVVEDLLTTYAGVDPTYIPSADWATVEADELAAFNLTATISEPTGVNTLLSELEEQCLFNLFWDDIEQEIVIKGIVPPQSNATLDQYLDASHLIEGSVSVKDEEKKRLTQVWVYYNMINRVDSLDAENFRALSVVVNTDGESVDQFGTPRVKRIFSRWFDDTNTGEALTLSSRLISRFRDVPKTVKFDVDAKDIEALGVSDLIEIVTRQIQDFEGANREQQLEIVSIEETVPGSVLRVTGLTANWKSRGFFISPDTVQDYLVATEEERQSYGFVSPDSGFFSDGQVSYTII